jgi:hypothetical protein
MKYYNYNGYQFRYREFLMNPGTYHIYQIKLNTGSLFDNLIALWQIKLKNDTNKTR